MWDGSTDEEVEAHLANLNALYPSSLRFQSVTARKEHEDAFGDRVAVGEEYLNASSGPGFDEVSKLSRRSLVRLGRLLFHPNPELREELEVRRTAEKVAEDFKVRRALDRMGPAIFPPGRPRRNLGAASADTGPKPLGRGRLVVAPSRSRRLVGFQEGGR